MLHNVQILRGVGSDLTTDEGREAITRIQVGGEIAANVSQFRWRGVIIHELTTSAPLKYKDI